MEIELYNVKDITCDKCGREAKEGMQIDGWFDGEAFFATAVINICEGCVSKVFQNFKKDE